MTLRVTSKASTVRRPSRPAAAVPAARTLSRDSFRAVLPPKKPALDFKLSKLRPKTSGDKRNPAEAVRDADLLLRGPIGATRPSEGTAEVQRDAANVNDSRDTNADSTRHQAAVRQLAANAHLEAAQLAKLAPTERRQYQAVKQQCLDAKDPVAALALQKLLFQGRIPGAKDRAGEGTTLLHLAALAKGSAPLAEGVERAALLTDLVQELATPSSINQGPRGTCAPTTLAIQLAIDSPAEYVRIATGLASPEGTVTLAGGQTLTREEGTAGDDRTRRSVSQRLMGSAFMEFANGERDYDNTTGKGAGAWSDSLDVLYEALTGRTMGDQRLTTDEQRASAMDSIDRQLRAKQSVPVAVSWGDGNHKVLVTGTETANGKEYIKYINPWGREERIPREDFEKRLADISIDPRAQVAGTVLQGVDAVTGVFDRLDPKDMLMDMRRARGTIPA